MCGVVVLSLAKTNGLESAPRTPRSYQDGAEYSDGTWLVCSQKQEDGIVENCGGRDACCRLVALTFDRKSFCVLATTTAHLRLFTTCHRQDIPVYMASQPCRTVAVLAVLSGNQNRERAAQRSLQNVHRSNRNCAETYDLANLRTFGHVTRMYQAGYTSTELVLGM